MNLNNTKPKANRKIKPSSVIKKVLKEMDISSSKQKNMNEDFKREWGKWNK